MRLYSKEMNAGASGPGASSMPSNRPRGRPLPHPKSTPWFKRASTINTLVDLARHFKGTGHIVRFIEYMDVGNRTGWKLDQVVSAAEIVQRIDEQMPLEPIESNYHGEVAQRYRYKDGGGEIGVIASVTQAFCASCTRARLSTDGKIYTCLFASQGVDLRGPLRSGFSDDELQEIIGGIWRRRTDRYSEERAELAPLQNAPQKVEMFQIGG